MERPATIKNLTIDKAIEPETYDFNNPDRQKLFKKIVSIPIETEKGKEEAIRFVFGLANYYKSRIKNLNDDDFNTVAMVNSTINSAFRNSTLERKMDKYIYLVRDMFKGRKTSIELLENRKQMWDDLIMSQFGQIIL